MEGFQDIEHFVKSLGAAIKKKIPTKVSQLTNDAGYKTTDTNTTYKLSKSGSTVTLTGSDGSTTSVTDSNTTYSSLKNPYSLTIQNNGATVASYDGSTTKTVNLTNATASSAGLMSAGDKSKLDGIGAGSNVKSVNGKTGAVSLSKADVGLGNVDNTSDAEKHVLANNILWGGPVLNDTVSPIDAGISSIHGANRLAFSNPNGITIEYSNDGGSTWNDYGASDNGKVELVTSGGKGTSWFYIGKRSTKGTVTVNDKLRVTFNASKCGVYTQAVRLLLNISINGASGSNVILETSPHGDATTFSKVGTYPVSGWSGWNSIPINFRFGGWGSDAFRLTFGITGLSSNSNYDNIFQVGAIFLYGTSAWTAPSNMAYNNHLYSFDYAQNAIFPAQVIATKFNGTATNAEKANGHTVNKDVPSDAKFTDTTYPVATSSADGLMSKSDKAKLDGIASSPSMLTNLGSTAAANVFQASPRPGVTGVLPIANGGTGASSLEGLRSNLDIETTLDTTCNILADNWVQDKTSLLYSNTVSVAGVKEGYVYDIDAYKGNLTTSAEVEAYNNDFSCISGGYAEAEEGKITFTVVDKPAANIAVRVKGTQVITTEETQSAEINNQKSTITDLQSKVAKITDKIYPVGSIYISVNSTSPADLFGGTWEQIKDRFLLAAGNNYAAGSTGGEATHKLTVDEMPKHRHSSDTYQDGYPNSVASKDNYCTWVNDGTKYNNAPNTAESGPVRTSLVGGSQPHNNMPPYIAVYMWKRVS